MAGLEQVPVISVNMSGLESASGFKLTLPLVRQIVASLVYGDCIMCVSNQTRPYELEKGTTDALIEKLERRADRAVQPRAGALQQGHAPEPRRHRR